MKNLILILFILFSISACKENQEKNKIIIPKDASLEELNRLLSKNPEDPALLYERAKYYYEHDNYKEAIVDLENVLKKDSLNPDYYHLLADSYMDSAQSRFALSTMKKLIDKFPERIPSLLKLSELFFIVKEYDNSISTLNSILYLSPNNPEAYFMLGVNFREMKEFTKAKNSFKTVVENNPEHVDSWIQLGEIAEEQKDKLAETYYKNALKADTSNINSIHYLAYYYQNQNKMDLALEYYRKMSNIEPNNQTSYLNAGLIYLKMDSLSKAFDNFNILVNIAKVNPKGYYYRGYVHYLNGESQKARSDFEQALKIDPEFEDAKAMLNKIKSKK